MEAPKSSEKVDKCERVTSGRSARPPCLTHECLHLVTSSAPRSRHTALAGRRLLDPADSEANNARTVSTNLVGQAAGTDRRLRQSERLARMPPSHELASEPTRMRPEPAVGARYAALQRSGTRPEKMLRSELHRRGRRFRVNQLIPGIPRRRVDIAFTRVRLVVQVDGCFWHDCPDHGFRPKTNSEWWSWKLKRNAQRDRDTDEKLAALGWTVLRIWEHTDAQGAADLVELELTRLNSRPPTGRMSGLWQPPQAQPLRPPGSR